MANKLRKFPKAGTIGHMVLTALAKNPDLKTDQIQKQVLKKFPESKFNAAHMAWYKNQVKNKNYILPTAAPKKARAPRKPKAQVPEQGQETTVPVTTAENGQ